MVADDRAGLLSVYDAQLRTHVPERLPEGVRVEHDGPLLRTIGFAGRGWIEYRDLGGLEGAELDELIERQVRYFAERGEQFEWKLHGHDQPPDLEQRLRAAGFASEDRETVVIARVADLVVGVAPPPGIALREVRERADLERIAALQSEVFGHDHAWLPDALAQEQVADPEALVIVIAEADDLVVCAGWVRFPSGTEFATLWGGGTRPGWRSRGIYRSLVADRARLAAERGRRYVEVDASDESRPILERLGFVPVTTTTPFVWSPPR